MGKVWYASSGKQYKEDEPAFFDPTQYEWAKGIEQNWSELKKEIDSLISEQDKSFTSNSYTGLVTNNGWSSLSFLFWGYPQKDYALLKTKCPGLTGYLAKIPGIVSISLSRLSPQTILNEHRGDTNAVFRCHLGIEIPASLPQCGLKVGNEEQSWTEGKWVFFNDAWKHSAWNKTDSRRIVLIVDVLRPEFSSKKRVICTDILARHVLFHYQERSKIIKGLPRFLKGVLFLMICIPLYIKGPRGV
jgi:aspartyl/asparaginyl beta-hydroxylase (cupin superfamily)